MNKTIRKIKGIRKIITKNKVINLYLINLNFSKKEHIYKNIYFIINQLRQLSFQESNLFYQYYDHDSLALSFYLFLNQQ
jgi:hypothetical protein